MRDLMFSLLLVWTSCRINGRIAGDLGSHGDRRNHLANKLFWKNWPDNYNGLHGGCDERLSNRNTWERRSLYWDRALVAWPRCFSSSTPVTTVLSTYPSVSSKSLTINRETRYHIVAYKSISDYITSHCPRTKTDHILTLLGAIIWSHMDNI